MESESLITPASQRPSAFVASSTQGRAYALAVQEHLAPHADVDVWSDDDIFRLNRAYLDTLLDSAGFYDYGIAVMTPDDEIKVRGEAGHAARDNVIFEYGLFLGRLGPHRAFMLKETSVRTFSDFAGIEVAGFELGPNPLEATRDGCRRILRAMEANERNYDVGFLPSTALAVGYYHNFLKRLIDAFLDEKDLWVADRQHPDGKHVIDYADRSIEITVLIPQSLDDLEEAILKSRTRRLTKVRLETTFRSYPFYVDGDLDGDPLKLFDIPTTLSASKHAIEAAFSPRFLSDKRNLVRIERREISNFEKTLRLVLPPNERLMSVSVAIRPLESL